MRVLKILLLGAGLLAVGFCAGCQKKFTRQRYETIYIGMPDRQVRKILGEPHLARGESWRYLHEKPFYKAIIEFENGRVKSKSWSLERPSRAPHSEPAEKAGA